MVRTALALVASLLATSLLPAAPSVEAIDFGVDDLVGDPNLVVQIVTDEPAETMQIELAVEWSGLSVDDMSMPPSVVAPFTVPLSAQNPFTGTVTSGLWIDPLNTDVDGRLFASFEATEPLGVGVHRFLTAEHFGAERHASLDVFGLITVDGVPNAVSCLCGPLEPPIINPDLDLDGDVDITDFGLFADNFGMTGIGLLGDIDRDNDVDITDFGLFADAFGYGTSIAVPEPSAMILALTASLAANAYRLR